MCLMDIIYYKLNMYKKLIVCPKFYIYYFIIILGTVIELNCQHLKIFKNKSLRVHEVYECERALAVISVTD